MVWQQEHSLVYEDFLERYRIIVIVFLAFFVFLSLRLFHLQIVKGKYYRTLSEQQRTHIIQERAPRGIIYDRHGAMIVGNKTVFVALFYPFSQGNNMPSIEALDQLKGILTVKDLSASVTRGWRSGQAVRLADNLTRAEMFRLQEQRLALPGISVVKEARRNYGSPEANSHLVGYLSEISTPELDSMSDEGYKSGDWIGRGGLEQMYDGLLRGQDGGWQIEVDALGRQTRLVRHIPPVPGDSLYTTVDADLQKVAAQALKESASGMGAVVALDPRTGAVRALVSSPGFDPNVSFTREFSRYLIDDSLPLFNRAIQGLYPPGSIFKIITFAGALAEGNADPAQIYKCDGSFTLGNKVLGCWYKKGHGRLDLFGALRNSCNVYFCQLGLKIGPKIIEKYARAFHLGQLTGIKLPSEKKGLVPNNEWKIKKLHDSWQPGDTINMAIGQGPLWVTPAQMAVMISAVANGGTIYQPYIVDKIISPSGENIFQSQVRKKEDVSLPANAMEMLHKGLEDVVSDGTGRACYFHDLKVAGKTGTAQNPQGKDHAWFVAYAPAENPELAIAVIVQNGGGGGAVAGPVARQMFMSYFKIKEDKAVEAGDRIDPQTEGIGPAGRVIENVTGNAD